MNGVECGVGFSIKDLLKEPEVQPSHAFFAVANSFRNGLARQ